MSTMAFQITSLMIVYSAVYLDADQRKHQSSASLAFVRGIHRGPVNSPHKWPVTRKKFPLDDVIMERITTGSRYNNTGGYWLPETLVVILDMSDWYEEEILGYIHKGTGTKIANKVIIQISPTPAATATVRESAYCRAFSLNVYCSFILTFSWRQMVWNYQICRCCWCWFKIERRLMSEQPLIARRLLSKEWLQNDGIRC